MITANANLIAWRPIWEEVGLDPNSPPATAAELMSRLSLEKVDENGNVERAAFCPAACCGGGALAAAS